MILYTNGTIKITEQGEVFKGEDGADVVYFKNYCKNSEGEVIELNSKDNYEQFEGKEGVLKIRARKNETSKGYKLTLAGFSEGNDLPADSIEF